MNRDERELLEIIRDQSLQIGEFTLSSGKKSSYYLDCRVTTLHPRGALLAARLLLDSIRRHGISAVAVGGLTLGADPVVASMVVVSGIEGRPLPGFIVRKEQKEHGMRRQIEGWRGAPGSRVIIVDDVCTSGASLMDASRAAESVGFEVAATMCIVDRLDPAAGKLKRQYPFYSIFTVDDILPAGTDRPSRGV